MATDAANDSKEDALFYDALRFLALDSTAKSCYLTPPFEPTTFHMRYSDHVTGNPLSFLTALADDLCQRDSDNPQEALWLRRLSGVLASLDYSDRAHYWSAPGYWQNPSLAYDASFGLWDALQHLAEKTLHAYALTQEAPLHSCAELVRSFSDAELSHKIQ